MADHPVEDWDTTDDNNATIDGHAISENQDPGELNDAMRSMTGAMARLIHSQTGEKVSTGTADAQVLATGLSYTTSGPGLVAFRAGAGLTVTGACTINVDSFGVQSIKRVDGTNPSAGDITAGGIYLLAWQAGTGVWQLLNPTPSAGISNLVEDTTPQLGGDLDLNGNAIDFPTTANITDVLDEDNMASDSPTVLATQQSIKAYADTKAAATQDDQSFYGVLRGTVLDGDVRIILNARRAGTITGVTTRCSAGTATLTVKINTTALGGTANSVSTSEQTQAHASANAFAIGDDIVLTIASASGLSDLSFSIEYEETLD